MSLETSHDRVTHVTQNEAHCFSSNTINLKIVCMNIKGGVCEKIKISDNLATLTCSDIIVQITEVITPQPFYVITQEEVVQRRRGLTSHADL